MERYFIRNCLGQIVGNPKGYVTYKGANMIFNRQKMQVELIDLANAEKAKGSVYAAVMIGSIKLEVVPEKPVKTLTVVRVENKNGFGMYSGVWFECELPNDENHPTIEGDSLYKTNLEKFNGERGFSYYGEPAGHRFGFLDLVMLRRWIYNDKWLTAMSDKGAVICTYQVPKDSVIVGRTQVTFDFEKAVCLDRKPLASVLEQA